VDAKLAATKSAATKPSAICHFVQGDTGGSNAGGVAIGTVGMNIFEQTP
jgi:hypothetical protein